MGDWLEAEQRSERAQQLSESFRWAEALAEIELALSINPHNASWHAQRGMILEELFLPEDAVGAFRQALELGPEDSEVAVALGESLLRLGRFAQALEVFDELARLYPDFEPAYCHRILAYAELGRHDQAEEMFYLAQQIDDACPQCFFGMGVSLAARESTQRAIYCWQRVLELEPSFAGVNRRIAQAYRAQGKLDLARDYFLREVREDPGNTSLLYELAELTLESGRVATAAAKFAQIIELEPTHTKARLALGKVWLVRHQPDRALECFETIRSLLDNEPEMPELQAYLGRALYQLGRYAEALDCLKIAVESDTAGSEIRDLLGNCQLAMNKPAEAADSYRRVLALDANNAAAHHKLGVCLAQAGRYEAAVEHYLFALKSHADYGPAMYHAAVAYLRLARWRDARAMLHRALRTEPGNPAIARLAKRAWRHRVRHYARRLVAAIKRVTGRQVV